jgi:hypothetical protein
MDAEVTGMATAAARTLTFLLSDPRFREHIDTKHIAAAGHSIGGAAAMVAPRVDGRFTACINLDGAPFGEAAQGAVRPTLVLRSRPDYSDADLERLGRTRAQWEQTGEKVARIFIDLAAHSRPVPVSVVSVQGAAHMTFSDAPWVMPDTISRFGGAPLDPKRGLDIVATCIDEFTRLRKTRHCSGT